MCVCALGWYSFALETNCQARGICSWPQPLGNNTQKESQYCYTLSIKSRHWFKFRQRSVGGRAATHNAATVERATSKDARMMNTPSESSNGSAFTPVLSPKSTTPDKDREAFHWRTPVSHGAAMNFVPPPHLWSTWAPYPAAMEHPLVSGSSPLWPSPLCAFGGANYSSFFKERMYRLSACSEEEKPSHSYIGLIAEAILSSPEEKLILSDIYNYILSHYHYFRNKGTGWRNSIRHNLSLNDCFMKAGRSPNGKGHFWAINPLYYDDFRRGDFRRRRTQKRSPKSRRSSAETKTDEGNAAKPEELVEEEKVSTEADKVISSSPKPDGSADSVEEKPAEATDEGKPATPEKGPEAPPVSTEKNKSFDVESILAPESNQRENLVLSFLPRPYSGAPVLCSPCTGYSNPEFVPGSPYERGTTPFFTYAESPRYPLFPYRIAC